MHNKLPLSTSLLQQIELLRSSGDQFSENDKQAAWLSLDGVMLGEIGHEEAALYDSRIIPHIPELVVPSPKMLRALMYIRPAGRTRQDTNVLISTFLSAEGLIVGFSGYGTGGGFSYDTEHDAIAEIYQHAHHSGPAIEIVVDGGTGFGVPGLSGALATQHGITTVGFLPARSLRGAAPRETIVVTGEEFGDEAESLGSAPDVVIALGGGPIAEKEIGSAISAGSMIVLAALKDYPESSVVNLPKRNMQAREAERTGRLVTCKNVDEILDVFNALDIQQVQESRHRRMFRLRRILAEVA